MTPKNHITQVFRDTVLDLARDYPFARELVNSGRLSRPCTYEDTPLSTLDSDDFDAEMRPGSACVDAPVSGGNGSGWLLNHLGNRFSVLVKGDFDAGQTKALEQALGQLNTRGDKVDIIRIDAQSAGGENTAYLHDEKGCLAQRYDLRESAVYLIRPDQHVAARWRSLDSAAIAGAIERAMGFQLEGEKSA